MTLSKCLGILVLCLLPLAATAEDVVVLNGDDTFIGGDAVLRELDTAGDAFVSAETASLGGSALGDLHVAGFDVVVRTNVAEDLYGAGATVELRGEVAGDMTAAGFTVRTSQTAETAGNARLAGNTVVIDGPISGSLSAMGRTVILNAAVGGDARITAKNIVFGENARIGGRLTYAARERVNIPEQVISSDRVTFGKLDFGDAWREIGEDWPMGDMPVLPGVMSMLGAFLVSLLFFMVIGALALAFMPNRLEGMRLEIAASPARSILLGVIGLALLFGLVPIAALTIVGLPFLPFNILAIALVWTLGYALGAYAIAMFLWRALGGQEEPVALVRILLLAAAVTVAAILNFIPFVGWAANYTIVLIGVGGITRALFKYFIDSPGPALDVDMKKPEE